jgi:glycosyltransferase involved in cell wall biosynthesis
VDRPTPLLSVTVLNYNYGHFLPTCLDSILGQTFKDFEVILINDTSTDNSIEVIQPYLRDRRVRLIDHKQNKGFVGSLIEGADESRGKYITVISADDWVVEKTAFEKQIAVLEQDAQIAMAYSAYGHYYDSSSPPEHIWRSDDHSYVEDGREAFKRIILQPYVLHSGTIIRASAYRSAGGYSTTLHYAVDVQIFLDLCHVGKAAYIDEMLYGYRRHRTSMSKTISSLRRTIDEVLRVFRSSFAKLPSTERRRLRRVLWQAEQRALIAYAADEIFKGEYNEGWRGFGVPLRMRPVQTLFQKMTPILVLRTVLGKRGYQALEQLKSRFSSQTGERVTAEKRTEPI